MSEIKSIKVLGLGCKSCHDMLRNTKEAAKNLGLDIEVEYETDIQKIMGYGVTSVPGLVINEKAVSVGRLLRPDDIKKILFEMQK